MTNLTKVLFALAPLWPLATATQRSEWIGAKACGACHAAEFARQAASAHARSLYRTADHPLAGRFVMDGPLSRAPGFHFSFPMADGGLRFRADDGKYVTDLPVEWAFGAGQHAVTFLSKATPDVHLELAFSYYADTGSFDLTPRHETLHSSTLHEAMGQPIQTRTAGRQCFGCHSTGPVTISQAGDVHVIEAGVHCEGCHGPGGAHRAAALRGDPSEAKRLIRNPGTLSGGALNEFCGACHRVAGNLVDTDWNSPWTMRHQPPYLARSRCFQESGGRVSCLTCHDPHDSIRRSDAVYYRGRCISCHSAAHRRDADCTQCHMPAVRASSHLSFRNHQIGIYH